MMRLVLLLGFVSITLQVNVLIVNNVQVNTDITKRVEEMKAANLIQDEKINEKLNILQESVKKLDKPEKPKEEPKEEKKIKAMDVADAVGDAIEGLPDIVAGFQTRDFQSVMKGSFCLLYTSPSPRDS